MYIYIAFHFFLINIANYTLQCAMSVLLLTMTSKNVLPAPCFSLSASGFVVAASGASSMRSRWKKMKVNIPVVYFVWTPICWRRVKRELQIKATAPPGGTWQYYIIVSLRGRVCRERWWQHFIRVCTLSTFSAQFSVYHFTVKAAI